MGIKANFSIEDIRAKANRFLAAVDAETIDALKYLGEMCVKHAKEVPMGSGYQDQTGNLRSSTGYALFRNGELIFDSYKQVKQGSEGVKVGKELANSIGKTKRGLALVVTAGMNYAACVEARGKDVLAGAENVAKQELPRMLEELKGDIGGVI